MFQALKSKLRDKKHKSQAARLDALEPTEVFDHLYKGEKLRAKETVSGKESNLESTQNLRIELPKLLKKYKIRSIFDAPCGDFNWMQHVNLDGIEYIGADIVPDLIESNIEQYQADNVTFQTINLIEDSVPKVDLVFVRDCFVHLSEENALKAVDNIKASGSRYLLITNFPDVTDNEDIATGQWRKTNLNQSPFNFPPALELLNDAPNSTSVKVMGLWKINFL